MILKDAIFQDNNAKCRFELHIDNSIAFAEYIKEEKNLTIFKTVIPESIALIDDIAAYLMKCIIEYCGQNDYNLVAICPFANAIINRERDLRGYQ